MAKSRTTKPPAPAVAVKRVQVIRPPATHPRRSLRLPIPGVLVAVEAPGVARKPWVVAAVDLSADGMGLLLPGGLRPECDVRLSFQLGDGTSFSRVPARVLHSQGQAGGVRFNSWTDAERVKLLEYLVRSYESNGGG
jgi:hypothetical protein